MERRRWMRDDLGDFYIFLEPGRPEPESCSQRQDHPHRPGRCRQTLSCHAGLFRPAGICRDQPVLERALFHRHQGISAEAEAESVGTQRQADPCLSGRHRNCAPTRRWPGTVIPAAIFRSGCVRIRATAMRSAGSSSCSPTGSTSIFTTLRPKRLFSRAERAFSHGCIRVSNPFKLADVLLADVNADAGHWEAIRDSEKGPSSSRRAPSKST